MSVDLRDPPEKNAVVLVTGSTDGIGLASAIDLAKRGHRVVVHGRSPARIERAAEQVEGARRGALAGTARADFASLAEVRAMVERLASDGLALDVLVNNAGIIAREKQLTVDGFERTFAVNHLAPFLLTGLVLGSPVGASLVRIVNVSSGVHRGGRLSMDDLRGEKQPFSSTGAYATSKLANVLFTVELARRVADRGIAVNAMHPGVIGTKLLREGFGGFSGSDTFADSSALIAMLGLGPASKIGSGRYYSDGRGAPAAPVAKDEALARAFFEESARLVGLARA